MKKDNVIKNYRKANMIFNKNGNGYDTTRITIPVIWAKNLGFSSENRQATIKLDIYNKAIIIKKQDLS